MRNNPLAIPNILQFGSSTDIRALFGFPLICLLGSLLLPTRSFSATAVIPPENENQVGRGGGGPSSASDYRYQAIYEAAQFIPLMPKGGEILEIGFRLDEAIRFPVNAAVSDIEIRMSTSPSVSPVFPHPFASRVGADETIVFSRGSIQVVAEPSAAGPNPFSIVFPLTRSFIYNPERGDLVIDFWVYRGGSGAALFVDTNPDAGIAWGASNLSPTSDNPDAVPIMRLIYSPIPEPIASIVIVLGLILLYFKKRP